MLLRKEDSCVLLIDVQEKLTPLVIGADAMTSRCQWLMNLADEMSVPIIISEQYPSGLGSTVPLLQRSEPVFDKVHFSCWRHLPLKDHVLKLNKNQLLLIGIETHVCVMQTALDLLDEGYQVYVVVDAVSSRYAQDMKYGLKRMKEAGVELITSEMVFFEWIGQAGTSEFRSLSKIYLSR